METFKPLEDMIVKMYTCGPSTYQRPHIGNYRTFLFEDVLLRYLEYCGYKVDRLITLTDIEDKAIAQAEKEHISVQELTKKNEDLFFNDFELLKIKRPDLTVRASTIIEQATSLIKTLMNKGIAYTYEHSGEENIYYDPTKFAGFGKLAKLDMSKWPTKKRRFHIDTYPGMPWNRGDFFLWHGCERSQICWDTPVGRGRPAWNIQDAAIVTAHLGFTIDVACGGIDNLVRHHDYTIAVVEAVSGKPFARYWLHGGHLFVDGKKMSKSKGNVYYPEDLMNKGYRKDHIRFFLIYRHYRKRLNFTFDKLEKTSKKLDKLKQMIRQMKNPNSEHSSKAAKNLVQNIVESFESTMNNDLDVKTAFDKIYSSITKLCKQLKNGNLSSEDAKTALNALRKIDEVLQVVF
jgi:cysteinyl-tRNA synthetase